MNPSASSRLIAHMDCDAFYYSVECLRDPTLIDKPVIVAGDGPRAVVTTASYAARKYGVGSAMPASKAKRLCPHAIVVPPHGEQYRAKSREVWDLVRARLGREMQHVSLDEAYVELTGLVEAVTSLRALVDEVRISTGITISVGVGPSRLVAKCCSDYEKPAGFTVMTRARAQEVFAASSARILPGIGPKTFSRLLSMGVVTVGHLQRVSEVDLIESFGARHGRELKARALFDDDSPVETLRIAKSKSNEHTFDEDVSDPVKLEEVLVRLAEELCGQLQAKGKRGRTIGIKVRLDDWTTVTRDRSLGEFTNDNAVVTALALALLREYAPARPVRLLGVRVSGFLDVVGPLPIKPVLASAPPVDAPNSRVRPPHQQLVLPI